MGGNGEYGCCPVGEVCEGVGGSQFIDVKIGGSESDGGSGNRGGNGGGGGGGDKNEARRIGREHGGLMVTVVIVAGVLAVL